MEEPGYRGAEKDRLRDDSQDLEDTLYCSSRGPEAAGEGDYGNPRRGVGGLLRVDGILSAATLSLGAAERIRSWHGRIYRSLYPLKYERDRSSPPRNTGLVTLDKGKSLAGSVIDCSLGIQIS